MLKPIHFGTCCVPDDASWMINLIAWFGNFPSWLVVANFALGMVNRDIYFLVASNVQLFLLAIYLDLLATVFKVPRPRGFDHELCKATKYAFPDPLYVSIMTFFLSALFGFWISKRLHKFISTFTFIIIVIFLCGYPASTLVSRYFDIFLLIANSAIALVATTLYILFYTVIVRDFRLLAPRYIRNLVGAAGTILGKECDVLNPECRR